MGRLSRGPTVWHYAMEQEALLRRSRGMAFKAAVSGLNPGGGKAVIIGDVKKLKNEARVARAVPVTPVDHDEVYDLDADIDAPSALGAKVHDATIARLRCSIIADGAGREDL